MSPVLIEFSAVLAANSELSVTTRKLSKAGLLTNFVKEQVTDFVMRGQRRARSRRMEEDDEETHDERKKARLGVKVKGRAKGRCWTR